MQLRLVGSSGQAGNYRVQCPLFCRRVRRPSMCASLILVLSSTCDGVRISSFYGNAKRLHRNFGTQARRNAATEKRPVNKCASARARRSPKVTVANSDACFTSANILGSHTLAQNAPDAVPE